MIVILSQILSEVLLWEAIGGNIVRGLDIERLFDFCVRSDEEVENDEGRNEEVEEDICSDELANLSLSPE
jgi:hypothetical protein